SRRTPSSSAACRSATRSRPGRPPPPPTRAWTSDRPAATRKGGRAGPEAPRCRHRGASSLRGPPSILLAVLRFDPARPDTLLPPLRQALAGHGLGGVLAARGLGVLGSVGHYLLEVAEGGLLHLR